MKNQGLTAKNKEELLNYVRGGQEKIFYTATIQSGEVSDVIQFANQNGYSVKSEKLRDPSDPGGCMSLLELFTVTKT